MIFNKKLFISGLASVFIINTAATAQAASKETVGGIVGGIIGGVIGSGFGKGKGKTAATIIGAIAGSLIGSEIGEDMDEADQRALNEAQHQCLEGRLGEDVEWRGDRYGSRTGAHGQFTTIREGYHRNGDYCREYHSVIYMGDRREEKNGIACTRRDGSWYESSSTEVTYGGRGRDWRDDGRVERPLPPPSIAPAPPVYEHRDDLLLSGYCADENHDDFYQAKSFAYSSSGLNMTSNEAIQWAMSYNETHRCRTIDEYRSRFSALYNFAYSSSSLNMTSSTARSYALSHVENMDNRMIERMKQKFSAVYSFAYSSSGLNLTSIPARDMALKWAEDVRCEDADRFSDIRQRYSREYSFAYSSSGLNMSSIDARDYATRKVVGMSICGDYLFAR